MLPHQPSLKKLLDICIIFQQKQKSEPIKKVWKQDIQHRRETKNYQDDDEGYSTAVHQTWRTISRISVPRQMPSRLKSLLPL